MGETGRVGGGDGEGVGEGEGEGERGGGGLRREGGGGERRGGGGDNKHVPTVVFTLSCARLDSMADVGFLKVPESETPRFMLPLLPAPQLWLPLLPFPKLLIPWLFTPKLRYPTLLRPTLPLLSGAHLRAPVGTHSTLMSHLQDDRQQDVFVLRSTTVAAPLSTSRVARL